MLFDFGGWRTGVGPVFMFLFWSVIVLGIVFVIRSSWPGPSSRQARGKTATNIVQERYARGEIDRQEYEQKMQDLERRA